MPPPSPTPTPAQPDPSLVDEYNAAVAHLEAGRPAEALLGFERVHASTPGEYEPLAYLAETLGRLGRLEEAWSLAQRAAAMRPGDVHAWLLVARAAKALGKGEEACRALGRAAAIEPQNPERWDEFITAHFQAGRFRSALEATERALLIRARAVDLLAKKAACQTGLSRVAEAIETLKAVVRGAPDGVEPAMALANMHAYLAGADPVRVFEAHKAMARVIERAMGRPMKHTGGGRVEGAEGRPLRVGLLSPDFRRHSVAYFVRPILRHVDRAKMELVCLSTVKREDAETAALRALAGEGNWRGLANLEPRQLAERIAAEQLDVLVDLAGNTENNNLAALALKPARVVVTYLGSPMTTGLRTVDVRLVDDLTDPLTKPATAEKLVSEELIRLGGGGGAACFVCFEPPPEGELPPVHERASGADEPVVFGSFNALIKLNEPCLRLWARVLEAVPGSRLVLKARGSEVPEVGQDLEERCRRAGLDPRGGRVAIAGAINPLRAHLSAYGEIDIALDTTPYCGTTTTCEAMLMGVPVVTLVGKTHASRVGLSLLTAVGLPELCAKTEDEFVRIAADLARDAARRCVLRAGLRERMLGSTLCDGPAFARRWEAAVERAVALAAGGR
ncbi:MAG: hypothetical protein ACKVS8_04805 [Phycisphaerales bacterium]